ncbi:MAG TPA: hypothetical protein ENI34_01670 [candidate division WOR-3 bacterium]|uniref:POTRA domain-containing protein n=1 Tax=candidate division WOR-3 bacterium TaxID=2052148 RepID=A0A9C9EL59_UNCW3|nr:hypothetical protein [candidate division WOR-3 bacterium]
MMLLILLLLQNPPAGIDIELTGNIFFSSPYLLGDMVVKDRNDLERVIASILDRYTDAGFPFCRISPRIVTSDDTLKKIVLKIEEGKRIIITDYLFKIQGKTSQKVLQKLIGLKKDTYFSTKKIESAKRRLSKTGVFEEINEDIVLRRENYYVLFDIKEKKSDYLNAAGTFAEGLFDFSASIYSLNLLGTLRRLQFLYEYKKLFSLKFTDPILLHPEILGADFSLWSYDTMRLVQINGEISAPLANHFTISLLSGIEMVTYNSSDSLLEDHTDNLIGVGAGFDFDKQLWSCEQKVRFNYLFRENDRENFEYDGAFRIKKLYLRPHYRLVKTDGFEFFDYYRLGGVKSLRGYFEEEFIVDEAFWFNLEYKFFFIYPLFDVGLIEDKIKYSYGCGIDAYSTFADASLIIAFPEQGTWRDGKVHLMLEKVF